MSLTADGRLVNASDLPRVPRRTLFERAWSLPVLALCGVVLGAAGGQPEVRQWLGFEAQAATPEPGVAPVTLDVVPFDASAAESALARATGQARACRQAGQPRGTAHVIVSFAPSGRATSVSISGPPFSGTAAGSCIASHFRNARVPAFDGDPVTVTQFVTLR